MVVADTTRRKKGLGDRVSLKDKMLLFAKVFPPTQSVVSIILSEKQCSRFRNSATVQNGWSEMIFGLFGVWN